MVPYQRKDEFRTCQQFVHQVCDVPHIFLLLMRKNLTSLSELFPDNPTSVMNFLQKSASQSTACGRVRWKCPLDLVIELWVAERGRIPTSG